MATANAAVSWSVPTPTQPVFGGHVVDPVGGDLAQLGVDEVVDVDRFGLSRRCTTPGPSSCTAPMSSFFFASTLITGSPVALVIAAPRR